MKHVIITLLFTVFTVFLSCFKGQCQIINTFAGNGSIGFIDGVAATAAELHFPTAVAFDGLGNVYIADEYNFRVRKVSSTGVITTIAGNGTIGYGGDGGAATAATLNYATDIAVDRSGNVYIADNSNNVIRKVNSAGIISTFAGTGTPGYAGDGGTATSAELYNPMNVAVDGSGSVYVSDYNNNVIRKINGSGIISTFAGNGTAGYTGDGGAATAAELEKPDGITFDASGDMYIGDGYDGVVRKVNTSGVISTFAGNGTYGSSGDGGLATDAAVSPAGVAVDGWGNVYIVDDDFSRVRKVNTSGFISTYAGNGVFAYCCDGGPATAAEVASPYGVAVDATGRVYIADTYSHRVRAVNPPPLIFIGGSPQSLIICENTVTNSINSSLTVSDTGAGLTETYSVTAAPSHGVVTTGSTVTSGASVSPAGWAYTPMTGYSGFDNFQVTVNNGYRSSTTTIYVTINALPNASIIMGSLNVCTPTVATLTDGAGGGVWTSATTSTATIGSAGIVTGVATGTSLISYTVANSCGMAAATAIITVNPSPGAGTIAGTLNVCPTATTTLSDGAAGGVWTAAPTGAATIGPTGIVTGVAAGTSLILYIVTNSCGTVAATAIVTVNPSPDAGSITGTLNVCPTATTTLSDGAAGGVWTSATTGTATIGSTGIVICVAAGTSLISYTVTNTCGSAAATETLTVNPSPNAGAITGILNICPTATTTLTDVSGGGVWTSVTTSAATIGFTGSVTGVAAGTSLISYTVTNSCGTVAATTMVTVNPSPDAGTITGAVSVCASATTSLADTASGGLWSSVSPETATVGSAGMIAGVAAGIDTVHYAVSNGCGTAVASYVMTVIPLPVAGTISGVSNICVGSTYTLTNPAAGGVWISSDTAVASVVAGSGAATGYMAGIYTISYSVTNMCGNATATAIDTITGPPTAGTITGSDNVCEGDTLQLADLVAGGIWSGFDSTATVDTGGIVTGVYPGADTIYYTVTTSCGVATASLLMNIVQGGLCNVPLPVISFNVKIYPNPNSGEFTVNGSLGTTSDEKVTLTITDMLGQQRYRNTVTAKGGYVNEQLQLSGTLINGIYLLDIRSGAENRVTHFVLN